MCFHHVEESSLTVLRAHRRPLTVKPESSVSSAPGARGLCRGGATASRGDGISRAGSGGKKRHVPALSLTIIHMGVY